MMSEIDRVINETRDFYGWRRMNARQKWVFLLGDGPAMQHDPRANLQWGKMETTLYYFLTQAYKARRAYLKN